MKTKNLLIIFILFLLIILFGGLVVFLTGEKEGPILSEARKEQIGQTTDLANQSVAGEKLAEAVLNQPIATTTTPAQLVAQLTARPEVAIVPQAGREQAEQIQIEQIQAVMLINGAEYGAAIKAGSSAYDLMSALKEQKKIDFKDKDYSGLGFFIEEINGVKNNPAGKNWVYYVNGQPAPVGVSNYKLKNNDTIEWKYEKKSF